MQNPKRRALKNIYCLLLYEYVDKRKNGKKINDIDKFSCRPPCAKFDLSLTVYKEPC